MNRLRSLVSARKRLLIGMAGVLIVLFSGFLVSQSFAASFSRYQAYRDAIVSLRQLEANFNQELLKSRYELFASYDAIVQNLASQEALQSQLSIIPSFVNAQDRRELTRILQERGTALTQKEDLSEWFKSRNALLKNSLRYLPFLTRQIEASFEAAASPEATATSGTANAAGTPIERPVEASTEVSTNATDTAADTAITDTPEATETAAPDAVVTPTSTLTAAQIATLRGTLNQLIRNLLLYNASGEEGLADQAEILAQQLSELENTLEIPEDTLPTRVFRSHANVILTTKPLVEELTGQLLLPLEQYSNELEVTLERAYQQAGRRANLFRVLNLVWLLLLLGTANFLFVKRFRQQDPRFSRYQRQVATLAETAHHLQAGNSELAPATQLTPFLKREDDLGELARGLQSFGHHLQQAQQAAQEEAFAFLTARLSLLTKHRRKLINTDAAAAIRSAVETSLAQENCELLDLQLETDQVSIRFNYPLSSSLSSLVDQVKRSSATALQPIAMTAHPTLQDATDIWSDAYLIASCEPPTRDAKEEVLASSGEWR